ncbi:MAG: phosphate ABC transporter permease subunit PstC [Defluviitaleaceae bacterium]|nr:phosphate ABC transporter permease subunit PstC [Defluviitaleaceae bacterium]
MKEKIIKYSLAAVSLLIPAVFTIILFFVISESIPAVTQIGVGLFDLQGIWRPLSASPSYSILPMILGTLYVSFLAIILSAPIACLCAIFLNYYVRKRISKPILAFIDLLAGVPSVIFGFIGLMIIVSNFEKIFNMSAGESVFAAAILLAIMLLPYIVSSYSESIERAKDKYGSASLALGTSEEYATLKIIIPITKNSVVAAVTMAFGRAMSETMAVMMIIGNAPIFPTLFGRSQTIPALTALEFGSAEYGSLHLSAIYTANLVLLILLCFILTATSFLKRKLLKEYD